MSMTRGSLPAGVYWRRRALLILGALVLVIGIARVLGGGSDGSGGSAVQTGAETSPSVTTSTSTSPSVPTSPEVTPSDSALPKTLASPTGRCDDADVTVTPSVGQAEALHDVQIVLSLQTTTSPACTWRVSPGHVTMKIVQGADEVWSSRECPRVVPTQDLVVRNNVPTPVVLTWDSKRSDVDCSPRTTWAAPGTYHLDAAAFGGEPSDVQFELTAPDDPIPSLTPSGSPSGSPSTKPSGSASTRPSGSASTKPTTKPSTQPSTQPSQHPSGSATTRPSGSASTKPSSTPTIRPSGSPTRKPSGSPTRRPSGSPSHG